jgi:hypothetical protein
MELSYNKNLTHEITSSAILDMDYITNPQHSTTRLEFIWNTLSKTPYIQTFHSHDLVFTDNINPKFFPRTFSTLFPFGLKGLLKLKSVLSICRHTAELNNINNKEIT